MSTMAWPLASGRFFSNELTGAEEIEVSGVDTGVAIRLLDSLAQGEGSSAALTASERDRAMASLLAQTYGSRIETTLACMRCASPFDLVFPIQSVVVAARHGEEIELPDGSYALPDGGRFRLPRGEDELAVAHMTLEDAEAELRSRCVFAEGTGGILAIEEAMDSLAPLIDVEIATICPECGQEQKARFDLQYYMLRSLLDEQPRLASEMHRIASSYSWSLAEIQGLRRSVRRRLVNLIEVDRSKRVPA